MLQKSSSIRLAQLLTQTVGFLLAGAGFIYVLENQGDPHHNYTNARDTQTPLCAAMFIKTEKCLNSHCRVQCWMCVTPGRPEK